MAETETTCYKILNLVTPDYARRLGLTVNEPVLICETDSTDSRPFIYQTGVHLKAPYFEPEHTSLTVVRKVNPELAVVGSHPKWGFGYDERYRSHVSWSQYWMFGFIGVIDPIGTVVEHEDYFFGFNRITDELRVKETLVLCRGCHDVITEGEILDWRTGYMYPVCNAKKFKKELDRYEVTPQWRFTVDEINGVTLSRI